MPKLRLTLALTVIALVPAQAALAAHRGRTPATGGIAVSPQPGTPDASPGTQISFLGASPGAIRSLVVSGSRSGRHGGVLRAYAAAAGASFLPSHRFTPGERVTIRARVRGRRIAFQFTVARPARLPTAASSAQATGGARVYDFVSRPDLKPPAISVRAAPGADGGNILLTPLTQKSGGLVGQFGALIVDSSGQPVWSQPAPHGLVAADLREQTYEGAPALTWWQGKIAYPSGVGTGEDVIVDRSYRTIARVRAGNGYQADLHEMTLTGRGTALIPVYAAVRTDLSRVGGSRRGVLIDSVVQEIDVRTGLVMFEWHAFGHIPLRDAYQPPFRNGFPYDAYHVNTIVEGPRGSLVVSCRNTWAAYDVRERDGRVVWRLGGKHSSFKLGRGVRFAFQHDVVLGAGGLLTIFDNQGAPRIGPQSRGLVIRLDSRRRRATLVRAYAHPSRLRSATEGSTQLLPDGKVFVGWGAQPYFSEFSADGHLLLDGRLPGADESYRAYLVDWSGTPAAPPDVAARTAGPGAATVYASWNGATGVASWQVLTGPTPSALTPAGSAPRAGFETPIHVGSAAYYAVRALAANGTVLGTSRAVPAS